MSSFTRISLLPRPVGWLPGLLALLLVFCIGAARADAQPIPGAAPSVWSDQGDYRPGATVTLRGTGWGPSESVHIRVNDDTGSTWSRDVDVTADAGGDIVDSFSLPNWFVAQYSVTATGTTGAVATTSFTDGNVSFALATVDTAVPAGSNLDWFVKWDHFKQSTACASGSKDGSGTTEYLGNNPVQNNSEPSVGNNQSAQPTDASATGYVFDYWSTAADSTVHASTCVVQNQGTTFLYAHFKAAQQTTAMTVQDASGTYGATAALSAKLTAGGNAVVGKTVSFTLNGANVGSATTQADGVATLPAASLKGIPAGSYASGVKASFGGDSSNLASSGNGALQVNRAALTITASSPSAVTYGDAAPAVTPSFAGFVTGEGPADLGGTLACGTAYAKGSDAGSYATSCSGATSGNYAISYVAGSLTVLKAQLSVDANDQTKTYGDATPALTARLSGFKGTDTAASANVTGNAACTLAGSAGSNVGRYADVITCAPGTLAAKDYSFTTGASGALTITPAALTITADSPADIIYGDAAPAIGNSVNGLANGDTVASLGDELACSTTYHVGSGIGTYPTSCSGAVNSNYSISYTEGSLNVTKAPLSVKADDASRVYGDQNPAFTAELTGVRNGDEITATADTTATSASGVGTYPVTPAVHGTDAVLANYQKPVLTDGTLTITKAPLTATANDATKVYGDENPALTGKLEGVRNGDAVSDGYTTDATQKSDIGTYDIAPHVNATDAVLANYQDPVLTHGTLTITKAPLTATADNQSREYGVENPELTGKLDGVKNDDDVHATYATNATKQSGVGSYAIVPQVNAVDAVLANYQQPKLVNGALSVTKAPLSAKADDKTRVYGDDNPQLTGDLTGVRNGDGITVTFTTPADAKTGVGTADIAPVIHGTTDVLANYQDPVLTHGALTITKAPLTVKADDATKVYGDDNPVLTGTLGGVKNDDDVHATYTTAATKQSGVGSYKITAGVQATDAVLANYGTPQTTDGTLTVTRAPLTALVSKETIVYGDTPQFSVTGYDGLRNGDTADVVGGNLSCTAEKTVVGGPYALTCGGRTAANYEISYTGGSLTVTKATLNVNANDVTKVYGTPDPDFGWSLSGFKLGDTAVTAKVTGAAACSRASGSDVQAGGYTITCEPGTLDAANYRFDTGTHGTLTITKASQTITFDPIDKKSLGGADIALAAKASSGLPVSYTATPASVCTIVNGTGLHMVGVGTCTVTAAQAGNGNYEAAASRSQTIEIDYPWNGFYSPIDNQTATGAYVLNVAKAGSTIPVKFNLGTNQGLSILWLNAGQTVSSYPSSGSIACDPAATQDTVEELSTATTSGLKYDSVANQYIYNWKTESSFSGTCRQLTVRLADGTYHRANFKFTK